MALDTSNMIFHNGWWWGKDGTGPYQAFVSGQNVPIEAPVYEGPYSGLGAASTYAIGTTAIINEDAVSGLTRPSSLGTKMQRVKLEVRYLADGATKAWLPYGSQTCFRLGGTPTVPAFASFAAAAATGIIGEVGTFPAGFLNVPSLEVWAKALFGRGAVVAGTADVSMTLGPTPGTLGSAFVTTQTIAANANSIAALAGSLHVRTTTTQSAEANLIPGGKGNIAGTLLPLTLNLAVAQTLGCGFSSATVADTFTVIALEVGIK